MCFIFTSVSDNISSECTCNGGACKCKAKNNIASLGQEFNVCPKKFPYAYKDGKFCCENS